MSHLTTYNSEVLVNCKKSLLAKALKDLGLQVDYNIKMVKNSYINEPVDACLIKDGKPLSVGFRIINQGKKSVLQVAGDFWKTGLNYNEFVDQLSQMYKKHDVIEQCNKMGWTIENKDITLDKKTNEVVIQASRFAV